MRVGSEAEMMLMDYLFEKMADERYQVRLCGEFVCYSTHTDETKIDLELKEMGFHSRQDFLDERWKGR